MNKRLREVNICVITDQMIAAQDLEEVVRQVLLGGAEMVQFREKSMGDRAFYNLGLRLKKVVRKFGALFMIDDRVDQVLALEADGVHIGQEDLPLPLVRKILGPGKIIGYSVKSVADAQWAYENGADYLGVGPIYQTSTKDAGPSLGVGVLRRITKAVSLPVLAIGGIDEDNVQAPITNGAGGVAVISSVMGAPDKRAKVQRLKGKVIEAKRALRGDRPFPGDDPLVGR